MILSGSVADMNDAFGVNLKTYEYPGGTYRGRTGAVKVHAISDTMLRESVVRPLAARTHHATA